MSLDILSKDILLKAQDKKEQFDLELKKEFSDAQEECNNRIDIFKSELSEKYDLDLKIQKQKILGYYKKEAKKKVLSTKSIILTQVYNKVLENFENLKKDEKEKFLENLILKAKKIIEFDVIICSKKDLKFIKSCVNSNVKLIVDENILGLKFNSNSGKEILDLTYLSILKATYDNIEDNLQNVLFNN